MTLSVTSGLICWLNADVGVYQDTAGSTPVTSDGQAVSLWKDQSGQGNHFLQSTNANKPLWYSSSSIHSLAGKNAIRFDGVASYLSGILNYNLGASGGASVFITFDQINATPTLAKQLISQQDSSVGLGRGILFNGTGINSINSFIGATTTSGNSFFLNTTRNACNYSLILNSGVNPVPLNLYYNGVLDSPVNAKVSPSLCTGNWILGSSKTISSFFDSHIRNFLVYNRPLSTSEFNAVENYLDNDINIIPDNYNFVASLYKSPTDDNLYQVGSNDGINWKQVGSAPSMPTNNYVISSTSMFKGFGSWWLIATSGSSANSSSSGIPIFNSSNNLKSWNYVTTIPVWNTNQTINRCWVADFFFVSGTPAIAYSVSTSGSQGPWTMQIVTATDPTGLTTWSTPIVIATGTQPSPYTYGNEVIFEPVSQTWQRWITDGNNNGYMTSLTSSGNYIYASSTFPLFSTTFSGSQLAYPDVIKHPDNSYTVRYDAVGLSGTIVYSKSNDLSTWSNFVGVNPPVAWTMKQPNTFPMLSGGLVTYTQSQASVINATATNCYGGLSSNSFKGGFTSVQWQQSLDGQTWNNATGVGSNSLNTSLNLINNSGTYFRLSYTDAANNIAYSNVVLATHTVNTNPYPEGTFPNQYNEVSWTFTPNQAGSLRVLNGGTIFAGGIISSPVLFNKMSFPYMGAGSRNSENHPQINNNDVTASNPNGTFATMVQDQYVILTFNSQLAGVSTNILGSPSNHNVKSQNISDGYVDTVQVNRGGGWYYNNGLPVHPVSSRDNIGVEAYPGSYLVPSRLFTLMTGKIPTTQNTASKND